MSVVTEMLVQTKMGNVAKVTTINLLDRRAAF